MGSIRMRRAKRTGQGGFYLFLWEVARPYRESRPETPGQTATSRPGRRFVVVGIGGHLDFGGRMSFQLFQHHLHTGLKLLVVAFGDNFGQQVDVDIWRYLCF